MALAISPLGLPGQLASLVGSIFHGHGHGKSGKTSANFGDMLSNQLAANDPQAQLTNLVQNGTPISTVVDTLANQIANSVQQTLPASQLQSGASRTMLVSSIKTALSPPSNAPPGDAATQVAALAQRLKQWLSGVARVADRQGQQNDISGQVLDATSARELPAQKQGPTSTPSLLGTDSLVQSLLSSAMASLTGSKSPGQNNATPTPSFPAGTPATSALAPAGISQLAHAPPPDPSAQTSQQQAAPAQNAANSVPNPSDLVARMLARAAGVDAAHNAELATVAGSASPQLPRMAGTSTTASPAAMAAKLTMLLTDAVAAGAQAGSENPAGQNGRDASTNGGAFSTAPLKGALRSDASSLLSATPSLPSTPSQPSAFSTPASTAASVDPNAIAEQVVKSMAMRTGQDGTSEVRLRLQPESLGTVTLKLTVEGNSVSASAVAQTADARNALLANHQQLARSLSEVGLKLTGFTVDLSGGHTNQQQRDRTAGFGRRYTVHEVGGATNEPQEIASIGPPLLHGSTLGLLSYLA